MGDLHSQVTPLVLDYIIKKPKCYHSTCPGVKGRSNRQPHTKPGIRQWVVCDAQPTDFTSCFSSLALLGVKGESDRPNHVYVPMAYTFIHAGEEYNQQTSEGNLHDMEYFMEVKSQIHHEYLFIVGDYVENNIHIYSEFLLEEWLHYG